MDELADIFPARAGFDPANDADAFFAAVPAKMSVALMLDHSGGPLQLLCTRNLRAMLRRRLGAAAPEDQTIAAPSKRVDYRSLVGGIAWRRVDSMFEMDLVYIEAARRAFPTHWRQLIPDRCAHFVSIDLNDPHPDFIRSSHFMPADGVQCFGPFPDRAKADRWIELARDAFDLCRYRNILVQAPRGRACAYKQMNKCPAPCDGSVPLESYRQGVARAVDVLCAPAVLINELDHTMKAHAANLEFEQAGKVKARLSTLAKLCEGANAGVRAIEAFRFVTVQPGPRKGTAKLFVVSGDAVAEAVGILDANAASIDEIVQRLAAAPMDRSPWPTEVLLGTACHHLAGAKSAHRFVAQSDIGAHSLAPLLAEAARPRSAASEEAGEAIRETTVQL